MMSRSLLGIVFLLAAACQPETAEDPPNGLTWTSTQDTTDRLVTVTGFSGPEAVRYDEEGDVYFVSNFNGSGGERDGNGFISRVSPDGVIETLEFATGTEASPFHAPRGMFIKADTLFAADVDGIHGFDRTTGVHLSYVDFSSLSPGFLNDISAGPDGTIYITDTGTGRLYGIMNGEASIVVEDSMLGQPNGITWDGENSRFLLGTWGNRKTLRAWDPTTGQLTVINESTGGNFDGIEIIRGKVIVASQVDTSLHVLTETGTRSIIKTSGSPADIAVDLKRSRVAVPYIALDMVDIWQLPNR
jgi:sugar lactone lactonase YvrE